MARLVIAIDDPLSLKTSARGLPAMIIGEYVRVAIQGRKIDGAFSLPRTALRDNTYVWVAGKDDRLEIREVRPIWRDLHTVLLKEGLRPGDRVVVSDLATPVPGMAIEVQKNGPEPIKPADAQNTEPAKS